MEHSLPESLSVLRIHKNPWTCDCSLRWLRRWVETPKDVDQLGEGGVGFRQSQPSLVETGQSAHDKRKRFRVSWDFATNTPTCAGPPLIKGVAWKYLTQDQFACPGRIVLTNTTVSVTERHDASLECLYSGDPPPKVTWKSRHLSLGSTHHFRIVSSDSLQLVPLPSDANASPPPLLPPPPLQRQRRSDGKLSRASGLYPSSLLVIPFVQVNQSGDYTCVVENSAGRAEATFKLQVLPESERSGNSSSSSLLKNAFQLEESDDVWRRDSILGVTASLVVLAPLMLLSMLAWHLKRRRRRRKKAEAGKRKNPFNRALAVPLTERSNDACATDDDDVTDFHASGTPSVVEKQNGGAPRPPSSVENRIAPSDRGTENANRKSSNRDAPNRSSDRCDLPNVHVGQDFDSDVVAASSKEKLLQLSRKKTKKRSRKETGTGGATEAGSGVERSTGATESDDVFRSKISLPAISERRPSNGNAPSNEDAWKSRKPSRFTGTTSSGNSDQISLVKDSNDSGKIRGSDDDDTGDDAFPVGGSNSETTSRARVDQSQRRLGPCDVTEGSPPTGTGHSNPVGEGLKYGTWSSQSSTNSTNTCHVFANFNSVPTFDLAYDERSSTSTSAALPHHQHHHHRHHFLPEVASLLTGNSHLIGPAPPLPDEYPSLRSGKKEWTTGMSSPVMNDPLESTRRNDFHYDDFSIGINNNTNKNNKNNNDDEDDDEEEEDFRFRRHFPPESVNADRDGFCVMKTSSNSFYEHSGLLRDCNRCPPHASAPRDLRTRSRGHDKY